MASDLDEQWLYGGTETSATMDTSTPVKIKEEKVDEGIKENGEREFSERPRTPTLDDSEVALNAPSQPAVSKIISTAPDLQPKQPAADNSAADIVVGEGNEEGEPEEDEGEGGDSDSDEDDVEITIGEITTAPGSYSRTPNYGRMGLGAGGTGSIGKKVDVDAIPQIGGQSLLEYDLDEAVAEKPWRLPGADIADYFNYGFTEDTWKLYCEKQRKMKGEVIQLNKIVVHSSMRPGTISDSKITVTSMSTVPLPPPNIMPRGFPPPPMSSLPPFLQPPPPPPVLNLGAVPPLNDSRHTPEPKSPKDELYPNPTPPASDNASDGRATPGIDFPPSSNKPPLLPPPNLPPAPGLGGLPPPPFGMPPPPGFPPFPPGQENLAAAMAAAMFGGGIRPPDSLPPHMLNNMPPFPLPPHGFSGGPDGGLPPPPFPGMPPNFPMDPGSMLDDRGFPQDLLSGRLLGQFPWDPSMGPPPQELLDAFSHRNDRRGSRSRSRSSSGSRSRSRSSSYDDRPRRKRERRHKRTSRSRSRSYEREREHRHRSGRHRNGDYHRSDRHDRDKERDRDKDRDRERETRRRREHREEKSRHERRRHRSSSRGGREEERSSRKEKPAKTVERVEQEISRDSSKTP